MKKFHKNIVSGWNNKEVSIHKKEVGLKKILKKNSTKKLNNAFYGNCMENVQNRSRLKFIRREE